jgi:uncharacterized membrane protein YkoI
MKCRRFLMGVAMVVMAGVPAVGAQTPAPAQKKAVEKEKKELKKEAGEESEKAAKLQLKDLPPAVRATVEAETKNATLKGLSKEKENGKTVYELESLVNGRTRDLMIDSAGKVYVVEEQLDLDKAPAPVKAALEKHGKILVLESVQENGKTHYEGQVQTKAGKKVAIELNADGTPVKK